MNKTRLLKQIVSVLLVILMVFGTEITLIYRSIDFSGVFNQSVKAAGIATSLPEMDTIQGEDEDTQKRIEKNNELKSEADNLSDAFPDSSPISNSIFDSKVSCVIFNNGEFVIGTSADECITYEYPTGTTSQTLINIEERGYYFSDYVESVNFDSSKQCTATAQIESVEIQQIISIESGLVRVRYLCKNIGSESKDVGVRIMLDTMMGNNDGAPFRANGQDITHEREYSGANIPNIYKSMDSLTKPSIVVTGYFFDDLYERPDKVQFAYWPSIHDSSWDYTTSESTSITGDSAVAVYFNVETLSTGETRNVSTKLGTSNTISAEIDSGTKSNDTQIKFVFYDKDLLSFGSDDDVGTQSEVTVIDKTGSKTVDKKYVVNYESIRGGAISFRKNGYRDYIIPKEAVDSFQYDKNTSVFWSSYQFPATKSLTFEKDHNDGKPYISTVFGGLTSNGTNSFSNASFKELQGNTLSIEEDYEGSVIISAVGLTNPTYCISQDSNYKLSNTTGVFSIEELYNALDYSKTVVAYAYDSSGKQTDPVKLELKKEVTMDNDTKEILRSQKLDLFNDYKITISEAIPIVGGSEISLDLFKIPIGVSLDGEKVRISLGFEWSPDEEDQEKNEKQWKALTMDLKTFANEFKKGTSENWKNSKQKVQHYKNYRNYIKNTYSGNSKWPSDNVSDCGFNVSFLGYIEGSISNGKFVCLDEAFVSLSGDFKYSYTMQGAVWIIPAYAYVEAGANIAVSGSSKRIVPDRSIPMDWSITLSIEPKIKGGAGAGVKGAVSVGAAVGATLPFSNNFSTKHRTFDITGSVEVESNFFVFNWSKELWSGTANIYDGYYGRNNRSLGIISQDYFIDRNAMNMFGDEKEKIEVVSRDYSENTSGWLSRSVPRVRAEMASVGVELKNLQTSVYPNSEAEIISFGNKKLMTWVEDDTSRDTFNRQRLMYSIYDSNIWSMPKPVCDDGFNDASPSIATDGHDVYFTWQKANRLFTSADENEAESENLFNSIEIYYAKYDSATDSIINAKAITENNAFDNIPSVFAKNGVATIYWIEGIGTQESYKLNKYSNSTITTVEDNLPYVNNIVAVSNNEVAFSCDTDGNTATTNDISVFINNSSETIEVEKPDGLNSAFTQLAAGVLDGEEKLFTSDGVSIYTVEDGKAVLAITPSAPLSNLMAMGGSGNVLVWTQSTESGNELWNAGYDNDKWNSAVQISNNGGLISNISLTENGNQIFGVCNFSETTVDEENESYEIERTNLCSFSVSDFDDISATIIDYKEGSLLEDNIGQIKLAVENKGSKLVSSIKTTVTDGLSTNISSNHSVNIQPGETQIVDIEYLLPEDYSLTNLNVRTDINDGFDRDITNNISAFEIGKPDLSVTGKGITKVDNGYLIDTTLENNSQIDAENVTIQASQDSVNEEENIVILNEDIGTISKNQYKNATIFIQKDYLKFDEDRIAQLNISVSSSVEDSADGDNSATVTIFDVEPVCAHPVTEKYERQEATCLDDGYEAYEVCSVCAEEIVSKVVIKSNGHSYDIKTDELPATCTEDGFETLECSACGKTKTETIEHYGHSYTDYTVIQQATCTEVGSRSCTCTRCGDVLTEAISIIAHTDEDNDNFCDVCARIIVPTIVVGENLSVMCYTDREISYVKFIPTYGGSYTFTSTASVDTYGYLCDSGKSVIAYNDDGGTGSNFSITYDLVAGTVYYFGVRFYSSSNSGNIDVILNFNGCIHSNVSYEITREASCTEDGVKTYTCADCGDTYTEDIPATGHTATSDPAVAPTCEEKGLTQGSHCSACGEVLLAQTDVDALGHSYGSYVTTKGATYFVDGVSTATCSRCSGTVTKPISKTVLGKTQTFSSKSTATSVVLNWSEVTGATAYRVYQYKSGRWAMLKDVTTNTYTVSRLASGTSYKFCVRAYVKSGSSVAWGATSASYYTSTLPGVATSLNAAQTASSIKLSWARVTGATLYRVYRYISTSKTYVKVADVTTNSCTVKSLRAGTTYYFVVRACKTYSGRNYWGGNSTMLKTTTLPTYVTSLKAKTVTKTSVTMSWSKVTGATGYAVFQYKGRKWIRVAVVRSNTATINSLKSATNQYFKVRAYKSYYGKNYYSSYSSTLRVKTK